MAEWASDNILGSSFITHSGPNGYEIHFATPDREKYLAVQEECRRQLGHAKPMIKADRIRQMTDEEYVEELRDWLKQEVDDSIVGAQTWAQLLEQGGDE